MNKKYRLIVDFSVGYIDPEFEKHPQYAPLTKREKRLLSSMAGSTLYKLVENMGKQFSFEDLGRIEEVED